MSTNLLPREIIERLVRSVAPVILENIDGYEIAAVRNGYANGFAIKVLASDMTGLGTQARYAIGGFKSKPSQKDFSEIVQNARNYIERNRATLLPYVKPQPVQFFTEDGLELFQALVRESAPVEWQNLSVDRLASIPSFQALVPSGTTLHECLQHLQEVGAVKLWATERDGFKVGITGAGRAYMAAQIF